MFGVPISDLMNPRVDQLIEYLNDYKEHVNKPNSIINRKDTRKVENMYSCVIDNTPLDIISLSNRQADVIKGSGETFIQRVKRSIKNF